MRELFGFGCSRNQLNSFRMNKADNRPERTEPEFDCPFSITICIVHSKFEARFAITRMLVNNRLMI